MPEGHTIFRHARDQNDLFRGERVRVSSPQGRFAKEATLLDGATFRVAESRGKHLFWRFSKLPKPRVVHIHLGLAGRFRRKALSSKPSPNVRVRIEGEDSALDLSGPAICELLTYPKLRKLQARIGEDPLDPEADPERVWAALSRTRRPMGTVLLDQSVIGGLGNIYRAELLFLHRIAPTLPARELDRARFDALWADSVRLLEAGVELERIVTRGQTLEQLRARKRGEGLWIYKRARCRRCKRKVETCTLAGRTLYYCPKCQAS